MSKTYIYLIVLIGVYLVIVKGLKPSTNSESNQSETKNDNQIDISKVDNGTMRT